MTRLILAFALAFTVVSPVSAGETVGQILARVCPTGYALDQTAQHDSALDSPQKYAHHFQASTAYHDCIAKTTDPYARDWLTYFYAAELAESVHIMADVLRSDPVVRDQMDKLASSTQWSDVKAAAFTLRDNMQRRYVAVYNDVYGRDPVDVATPGSRLFAANCASCHGGAGEGGAGPRLIGTSLSANQIVVWIKNPDPPMPRLYPSALSDDDVSAIADYVHTAFGH